MRTGRVKRKEEAEYLKYLVGLETEFGRRVLIGDVAYEELFDKFNSEYKRNAHRFNERSIFLQADVNHFEKTYKRAETCYST